MLFILLAAIMPEMSHLEADFVQVKSSLLFAKPEASKGHLTYREPDYLRWEYTSPQPIVWEVNGAKDNVSPQIKQLVVLILKTVNGSYLQPNSDYDVSWEGDLAILKPKRRDLKLLFTKITIRLNPQTGIADEVVLYEQSGDETNIRFFNVVK